MLALFVEKGKFGTDYILRIGNEAQIRNQLSYLNDWMNLERCGRVYGPKSDQKKLDILKEFLEEEQTLASLESFEIKLSTGTLKGIMVAETKEDAEKIGKYLQKKLDLEEERMNRFNNFYKQVLESYGDEEKYSLVFRKISNRQYVTSGIALEDF